MNFKLAVAEGRVAILAGSAAPLRLRFWNARSSRPSLTQELGRQLPSVCGCDLSVSIPRKARGHQS